MKTTPLTSFRLRIRPAILAASFYVGCVVAQDTTTTTPIITPAPAIPTLAQPVVTPAAVPGEKGIMLNFQGASLTDVLNYLSEAAGFIVIQEAPVAGTVNVVSRQPVTPDEAVDLVNAVLIEKGYIALRSGRILKIVNRRGAQMRDLPVETGSDPEKIPRKDSMVTQILPLRFGEAAKLVENIRPLLSESATISANESSNAILLTDTQTNVRRVAQIIQAVDTSVSAISTIKVFPLTFADAKEVATLVTSLFANSQAGAGANQGRGGRGGGRGFGGFGGFGGFPGAPGGGQGGGATPAGQSEARQAASRVVAVADEQSNSLIVSAPDEVMPTIKDIITQIDMSISDVTENRIFRLQHADAVELAELLTNLYADTATTGNQGRNRNRGFGGQGQGQGQGGQPAGAQSSRSLLQSKVVAVGDPRTNSLLVTAARDSMTEIAEMVGRLDATDAKKQRVFVHRLDYADSDAVAAVLRGMLGQATGQSANAGVSRLSERAGSGATMDASLDAGNGNTGGGGGGRR
ncbi:MAG TPA: secretin N-terminal domain-containing protein [Chthoniobacteraceae bacterium]|nr:secretin N-terminal domain-containing protein [Chthoniobacteraceae bacterium]